MRNATILFQLVRHFRYFGKCVGVGVQSCLFQNLYADVVKISTFRMKGVMFVRRIRRNLREEEFSQAT